MIRVKDAQQALNLDALLLALACPLFLRFHVFAGLLRRPIKCRDGLGTVAQTPRGLQGDIHVGKTLRVRKQITYTIRLLA